MSASIVLRIATASASVITSLAFLTTPVRAATDTGEIAITVVDSTTALPIADARTILLGPQTASSLTTRAGIIRYTDVPIGIYRVRVLHAGYAPGASSEFDVLPNRAMTIRVELALTNPGGLKTIGSVVARSNVSVASNDIADNSPIRRLSDSLTDALDKVAGVSVSQDATDPSGAITVSLNGHDESQTAISLDGIPLSAPGTSANLRAIGTDLFSGSSSSTQAGAGSLGGGVNFRTLQPTQSLQIKANGSTGTFDRSSYQLAATGSVGRLGLAVQHTSRGANSPLTFQTYRDQSGLTYAHEGESHSLGDFLKFRYRLGDERTAISGTALSNNTGAYAVCARYLTLLPCGIGPNNQNYGRFGFAYATISSLVGTVATTLTGFESGGVQNNDNANRYVLLPEAADGSSTCGNSFTGFGAGPATYLEQLCPSVGTTDSLTRGVSYSASIGAGRHTIAVTGTTSTALNTNVPTAGSRFERSFTTAITSSTYQINESFKANDQLTISPRVSLANTTTLGTNVLGGIGASWRPTASDTFGASANIGSSQANVFVNRSLSDPVNARFDCAAQTAIVNGPGDASGGPQSAVSLDATWAHRFRSGATLSLNAFSQVQSGQIINALIAEPAAYFAKGYLATLNAAYGAQSVCGIAAAPPRVFVNEAIGGTRRVYQGITANARIGLGRYLVALPNYTLNVAKLTAASGRLSDGPSTSIVGAQLPNRPIHRAGMTLDGVLPRSGTELLANVQYTGANNQANLGSYVVLSAGISHGFGPGRLTLFENNIFGTYGGTFATDATAEPLALSQGAGVLRTAATPLAPRTLTLSYLVSLGGPKPGTALASVATAAQRLAQTTPQPGASGAPGAAGPGNRFIPVPPPPGVDPLSLATSRTSCDVEAQKTSAPFLAGVRAYVAAYEAKATLPEIANIDVTAHVATVDPTVPYYLELRPRRPAGSPDATPGGTSASAAIARRSGNVAGAGAFGGPGGEGGGADGAPGTQVVIVTPSAAAPAAAGNAPGGAPGAVGGRALRGFTGCAYVTALTSADAKAKGIMTEGGRPGLFYVPAIGFVFVRPPELPQGGGSLKAGS